MNSPNITHSPLNREGALELGVSPCKYCYSGWATYSLGKVSSCRDTCEYIKIYFNEERLEQIKLKKE